jgi:hypothetical protein
MLAICGRTGGSRQRKSAEEVGAGH